MQIAINGQPSQSAGADWSGQHGMSADIDAVSVEVMSIAAISIDVMPAFARAENGATTSPTIKKIASRRQRWIECFTSAKSHSGRAIKSAAPSRNRQYSI